MLDYAEEAAVKAAVQAYIDAIKHTQPDKMTEIFHPSAVMSRHRPDGNFAITPDPGGSISKYMKSQPPTSQTSPHFEGKIMWVKQIGNMAAAWITEEGLEGKFFNTFFVLHKVDGRWVITTKATRGVAV
jgi:Putative lumazine-binding